MQELSLHYLYEAAKLGSMRAAADKLGIAVSSISRQIAQLEAEAGVALIEHGRRAVRLTEAGELMLEYYNEQVAQREAFETRLADLKGMRSGHVRLAIGEGFLCDPLSNALANFAARHNGLQVDVQVAASSNEVTQLVVEDEAHVGLSFQASDDPRLRVRATAPQPLCAIMLPRHPLARLARIGLADLAAHRACLPQSSFRTRQMLKIAEVSERIALQPAITSNSLVLLKELLRSGEFVTLLPLLAVRDQVARGELTARPIDSPMLRDTSVHLVCRLGRHLPPAAQKLMSMLSAYLDSHARPLVPDRLEETAAPLAPGLGRIAA